MPKLEIEEKASESGLIALVIFRRERENNQTLRETPAVVI